MANQTGRPVAPARKLVAAVMGTIAVFVMALGLGMSSWGVVIFGLAVLALSIALGMVNVVRRGARAWVAGSAEVKAISPRPTSSAVYGRAEIQAVVVAPGLPTSEVTIREPRVPVVKWPAAGDTLPITVDVDDMRRVRINWDDAVPRERGEDPPPPPAAPYDEFTDADLDADLLGDAEEPPWAADDRGWRGDDEPPPPPPPGASYDDPPVVVRDTPAGRVVEGEFVDHDETPAPLPRRAAGAAAPPPSARPSGARPSPRPRGGTATATADPTAPPEPSAFATPDAPPTAQATPPTQRSPQADDTVGVDLPLDDPSPTTDPEPYEPEPKATSPASTTAGSPQGPTAGRTTETTAAPSAKTAARTAETAARTAESAAARTAETAAAHTAETAAARTAETAAAHTADTAAASTAETAPARTAETAAARTAETAAARTAETAAARTAGTAAQGPSTQEASAQASSTRTDPAEASPAPGLYRRPEPTATSTTATPRQATPFPTAPPPTTPPPTAPRPSTPHPAAPTPGGYEDIDLPLDADDLITPPESTPAAAQAVSDDLIAPPPRPTTKFITNAAHDAESSTDPTPTVTTLADPAPVPAAPGAAPASAQLLPDAAPHKPAEPTAATTAEPTPTRHTPANPAAASSTPPDAGSTPTTPAEPTSTPVAPAETPPTSTAQAEPPPQPPSRSAPQPSSGPAPQSQAGSAPQPPPAHGGVIAGAAAAVGAVAAGVVAAVKKAGRSDQPTPEKPTPEKPAPARPAGAGPWADLSRTTPPDDHTDDLITAYPSARPGAAAAIHGVGITVLVTDLPRSIAFYRDTLGFYEIDNGDGSAVLASGDTRLVLRTVQDLSAEAGRLIYLNLEVGDIEAVYNELQTKGVTFVHPPQPVNRGDRLELWSATFHDPDAHNIAITQWRAIR